MSISSHLTPEPERRLWLILESTRRSVEWMETKLMAITAVCLLELAVGRFPFLAAIFLSLAALVCLYALSPLNSVPKWLPYLDPLGQNLLPADNLITPEALAKFTYVEAVDKMDRYLGGGISNTQYHEDLVRRIAAQSRVVVRKERLMRLAFLAAGLGQLGLLAR